MAIKSPYGDYAQIVKTTHFRDATFNISLSFTTGEAICTSFSYNRVHANNDLLIFGHVPMNTTSSYQFGQFIKVDSYYRYMDVNHLGYTGNTGDDYADHGFHVSTYIPGTFSTGTSHTVSIGWDSRGTQNERPASYVNPQNRSDRARETTTNLTILEIQGSYLLT